MRAVLPLLSALLLLALHHNPVAATGFSTFVVGPPVHEAITAVAAKMAGFTRTEVEHAINGNLDRDFPGVGADATLSLFSGGKDAAARVKNAMRMKTTFESFIFAENQPLCENNEPVGNVDAYVHKVLKTHMATENGRSNVCSAMEVAMMGMTTTETNVFRAIAGHVYTPSVAHSMKPCMLDKSIFINQHSINGALAEQADGVFHCPPLRNEDIVRMIVGLSFTERACLDDNDKFYSQAATLGKLLHSVQDSFSPAHAVRTTRPQPWESLFAPVLFFQDYEAESSEKHGISDIRLREDLSEYPADHVNAVTEKVRTLIGKSASRFVLAGAGETCNYRELYNQATVKWASVKNELPELFRTANVEQATIASAVVATLWKNARVHGMSECKNMGIEFLRDHIWFLEAPDATAGGSIAAYRAKACPAPSELLKHTAGYLNFREVPDMETETTADDLSDARAFRLMLGAAFDCTVECKKRAPGDTVRYGKMCMSLKGTGKDARYAFDECCIDVEESGFRPPPYEPLAHLYLLEQSFDVDMSEQREAIENPGVLKRLHNYATRFFRRGDKEADELLALETDELFAEPELVDGNAADWDEEEALLREVISGDL